MHHSSVNTCTVLVRCLQVYAEESTRTLTTVGTSTVIAPPLLAWINLHLLPSTDMYSYRYVTREEWDSANEVEFVWLQEGRIHLRVAKNIRPSTVAVRRLDQNAHWRWAELAQDKGSRLGGRRKRFQQQGVEVEKLQSLCVSAVFSAVSSTDHSHTI